MTTIAALRRRSDNLAQRWLRTGGDHARTDASSHHRTQPATSTFNNNLHQQAELLRSTGHVINRLQRLCTPALTLTASLKSP
jgi:hypothetical protein